MIGESSGTLFQSGTFSAFEEPYHIVAEKFVLRGGRLPEPVLQSIDVDFWHKHQPRCSKMLTLELNSYDRLMIPAFFASESDFSDR
jgi:hypothetical protein